MANYREVKQDLASKLTVAEIERVEAGDIDGTEYVAGSEGQIKTITEVAKVSDAQELITTFFYEDDENPTKITKIDEEVA